MRCAFSIRLPGALFTILTAASLSLAAPASFAETLALVGGTVIDTGDWGRSEADIEDAVVILAGGEIVAVGERGTLVPPSARVLDVRGKFIVPGLVDGFGALNNQNYANAYLYSGVTSLITVSGGRRGRLFTGGDPGPHLHLLEAVGFEAGSLEEHLEATEALAEQGNDILLMMYALTPEQLPVIVRRARELGMGTIGELGFSSYADGIAAGIDAFVHTTRYSLGLAPPPMIRSVAEEPFSNDLGSSKWQYYKWLSRLSPFDERLSSYAKLLASGSASLMPTFGLLYLDLPSAENPWDEPIAQILDPQDINNPADPETGAHKADPAHQAAYSALARSEFILEEAYYRAGAHYLAGSGTDVWGTMPGISLHHELEALVRIGHSPRQALAAATSNFEKTFSSWGAVGQVRPGYRADLLVLDRDPRQAVENLESIHTLILAGQILDRPALLNGIGRDGEIIDRRPLKLETVFAQKPPEAAMIAGLEDVVVEEITYWSDGLRVKGYLARPRARGSYPGVIVARGGNREFGAITPQRAMRQLGRLASWGYVVAASQYRGNAGGEGREEFGGADVDDLLNLIPLLESEPLADAGRLGIYGGSRGGLMTYLALARTDRFAAAVVRAGLSDLIRWQQERPEMAEVFRDLIPGYDPADESTLLSRSPARWAQRLSKTTPILLLHGTADWRVSPQSALRMASALLESGHPFRLVLLEGSDHSLSEHRGERDRLTREWLDRYVRDGAPLPDLVPHGE